MDNNTNIVDIIQRNLLASSNLCRSFSDRIEDTKTKNIPESGAKVTNLRIHLSSYIEVKHEN